MILKTFSYIYFLLCSSFLISLRPMEKVTYDNNIHQKTEQIKNILYEFALHKNKYRLPYFLINKETFYGEWIIDETTLSEKNHKKYCNNQKIITKKHGEAYTENHFASKAYADQIMLFCANKHLNIKKKELKMAIKYLKLLSIYDTYSDFFLQQAQEMMMMMMMMNKKYERSENSGPSLVLEEAQTRFSKNLQHLHNTLNEQTHNNKKEHQTTTEIMYQKEIANNFEYDENNSIRTKCLSLMENAITLFLSLIADNTSKTKEQIDCYSHIKTLKKTFSSTKKTFLSIRKKIAARKQQLPLEEKNKQKNHSSMKNETYEDEAHAMFIFLKKNNIMNLFQLTEIKLFFNNIHNQTNVFFPINYEKGINKAQTDKDLFLQDYKILLQCIINYTHQQTKKNNDHQENVFIWDIDENYEIVIQPECQKKHTCTIEEIYITEKTMKFIAIWISEFKHFLKKNKNEAIKQLFFPSQTKTKLPFLSTFNAWYFHNFFKENIGKNIFEYIQFPNIHQYVIYPETFEMAERIEFAFKDIKQKYYNFYPGSKRLDYMIEKIVNSLELYPAEKEKFYTCLRKEINFFISLIKKKLYSDFLTEKINVLEKNITDKTLCKKYFDDYAISNKHLLFLLQNTCLPNKLYSYEDYTQAWIQLLSNFIICLDKVNKTILKINCALPNTEQIRLDLKTLGPLYYNTLYNVEALNKDI